VIGSGFKFTEDVRAPLSALDSRRGRAWARVLVFFLLLCFVVQGSVVQSHVHLVEQASPLAAAPGPSHIAAAPSGKGDSPADCPLCQEAAMAGAYLLPPVVVLPPPPVLVPWIAAATLAAFGLPAQPLGWLSRAPPE